MGFPLLAVFTEPRCTSATIKTRIGRHNEKEEEANNDTGKIGKRMAVLCASVFFCLTEV